MGSVPLALIGGLAVSISELISLIDDNVFVPVVTGVTLVVAKYLLT